MNSQQKIINLITICRRAGKLETGFDASKNSVSDGRACCILVSADISKNTLKKIMNICGTAVKVIQLDIDSDMLEIYLGRKTAVASVCDRGFAGRFAELSGIQN